MFPSGHSGAASREFQPGATAWQLLRCHVSPQAAPEPCLAPPASCPSVPVLPQPGAAGCGWAPRDVLLLPPVLPEPHNSQGSGKLQQMLKDLAGATRNTPRLPCHGAGESWGELGNICSHLRVPKCQQDQDIALALIPMPTPAVAFCLGQV